MASDSERLELVQRLILDHLVTAKGAVALGGSGARNADGALLGLP